MENFKFEVRTMGGQFFVPILVFILLCLIIFVTPNSYLNERTILFLIQVIYVPFSAWWITYLLNELYHTNGEEILINYFSRSIIISYLRFIGLLVMMVLILCVLSFIKQPSFNFFSILIFLTSQIFLISSFSMALTIYFKGIDITLMVITLYVATEAITLGDVMPWPHIFYFSNNPLPFLNSLGYVLVYMVFTIIFFLTGLKFIKSTERYIF